MVSTRFFPARLALVPVPNAGRPALSSMCPSRSQRDVRQELLACSNTSDCTTAKANYPIFINISTCARVDAAQMAAVRVEGVDEVDGRRSSHRDNLSRVSSCCCVQRRPCRIRRGGT